MTEKGKEYQEDLKELKAYQRWLAKQIQSRDWDSIANRVGDLHMNIIIRLMNVEKPNELNYLIWSQLDYVKDRIREIRKSLEHYFSRGGEIEHDNQGLF